MASLARVPSLPCALLVVCLALVVGAPAEVAAAAPPPRSGTILYDTSAQSGDASTEESCRGETSMVTIGAEGGESTVLAEGSDPAYSPDGELIAFSRCDGIQSDLFVMDADGTNVRQLTHTSKVSETEPTFSADGSRIFFRYDPESEGYSAVASIGVGGGGLKLLTPANGEGVDERPAVAPNGRFVVLDRSGVLYTIRPDGSHPQKLTLGWDPTVSPGSDRVIYSYKGQLWSIGPAGGHRRRLTHLRDERYRRIEALCPSISTDGRWVVFALEEDDSLAPGLSSSEKLDELSLQTGRVVTLTTTEVGGFYPFWRPTGRTGSNVSG